MKTYVLTIQYDEDTEEVEYLTEEILVDDTNFYYGNVDISEHWDEDIMKLLSSGGYIIGES